MRKMIVKIMLIMVVMMEIKMKINIMIIILILIITTMMIIVNAIRTVENSEESLQFDHLSIVTCINFSTYRFSDSPYCSNIINQYRLRCSLQITGCSGSISTTISTSVRVSASGSVGGSSVRSGGRGSWSVSGIGSRISSGTNCSC